MARSLPLPMPVSTSTRSPPATNAKLWLSIRRTPSRSAKWGCSQFWPVTTSGVASGSSHGPVAGGSATSSTRWTVTSPTVQEGTAAVRGAVPAEGAAEVVDVVEGVEGVTEVVGSGVVGMVALSCALFCGVGGMGEGVVGRVVSGEGGERDRWLSRRVAR